MTQQIKYFYLNNFYDYETFFYQVRNRIYVILTTLQNIIIIKEMVKQHQFKSKIRADLDEKNKKLILFMTKRRGKQNKQSIQLNLNKGKINYSTYLALNSLVDKVQNQAQRNEQSQFQVLLQKSQSLFQSTAQLFKKGSLRQRYNFLLGQQFKSKDGNRFEQECPYLSKFHQNIGTICKNYRVSSLPQDLLIKHLTKRYFEWEQKTVHEYLEKLIQKRWLKRAINRITLIH